jgi:hypothetical protein
MLTILPISFLFLGTLALVVMSRFSTRIGHHWPVALGSAFLAWISTLIQRANIPHTYSPTQWPAYLSLSSPTLQVDEVSWPFALALTTLVLAVILTDVARMEDLIWPAWAGSLGIGGFGLVALFASNPLTLVMGWMFLDILEFVVLLPRVQDSKLRRNLVLYSGSSLFGTILVFAAQVPEHSITDDPLSFDAIPQQAALILLIAIGLRLGIFPLNVLYLREDPLRRGLGNILRLTPVAASLVLLVRIADSGVSGKYQVLLLIAILIGAIYGAVAWARLRDEIGGRSYWILSISSIAMCAAIKGLPGATLAWSLALLYIGGTLFLASERERWLAPIAIFTLIAFSLLPLTPSLHAASIYIGTRRILMLLIIPAHALLMMGFVRYAIRIHNFDNPAPWVYILYPLGLALPPFIYVISGLWLSPKISVEHTPWWPGVSTLAFSVVLGILWWRGWTIPEQVMLTLDRFFSLRWLYRLANRILNIFSLLLDIPVAMLESSGGILWTLLLLTLLLSLLAQTALSGGG